MILDTNAVSDLSSGNPAIQEKLRSSRRHALPTIVIGEFRFGLERSRYKSELLHWLDLLEKQTDILEVTQETALWYAKVKSDLRTIGRPIPENDIWIAALAQQHGLAVLTRDAHFGYVPDLVCVSW